MFVKVVEAKYTVHKMPDITDIPLCEKNEIIILIGNERNCTVYIVMTGLKDLMFVQPCSGCMGGWTTDTLAVRRISVL